jgi:hypothetical protein
MTNSCQICQKDGTARNPAILLQELGALHHAGHALLICQDCLARREIKSWAAKREIGAEIARALEEHPQSHGHYSYLGEPNRIHLVRLRSGWVAQHVTLS